MSDPRTSFLTTAVPLKELIKINHFAFDVPKYQRPYQWDAVQTTQLLGDLHHGYLEHYRQLATGRPRPVLPGNLVLLHQDPVEFEEAEHSQYRQWWLPRSASGHQSKLHFCDVIDGQQRLTALYILYAALQHLLLQSGELEHKRLAYQLHDRFNSARLVLQTSAEKFDSWFSMHMKGDLTGLNELLKDNAASSNSGQEKVNAKIILKWLDSTFGLQQFVQPESQARAPKEAHELVRFWNTSTSMSF